MNDIDIYQLVILLSVSFMSAFSIALNNYAIDKNKGKQCIPLLYISECLVSGLSGFFLSILVMIFRQNVLICLFASGIGGLIGRKLLFVVLKLGVVIFSIKKNIDLSKIENILNTIDDDTDNKNTDQ